MVHGGLRDLYIMAQQRLARLNDTKERIVLFFVDLDNVKNLNDSFGHNAGDDLLIAISTGLKKLLLPGDAACRIGVVVMLWWVLIILIACNYCT